MRSSDRFWGVLRFGAKIFLLALASFVCAFLLWYRQLYPLLPSLGQASPISYSLIEEQRVLDEAATQSRQSQVAREAIREYLRHPEIVRDDSKSQASLRELRQDLSSRQEHPEGFSNREWMELNQLLPVVAKDMLAHGYIGAIDEESLRNYLEDAGLEEPTRKQVETAQVLLERNLEPNLMLKLERLQEVGQKAASKVEPVYKTIPAKTTVVERGEIVGQEEVRILRQLDLPPNSIDMGNLREGFGLTLAIFFSFWLFIRFERFHLRPKQALLLGSLVIMASSFAGTVALSTPQLLPIAAISMSVSLFFRASVGFVSALLFAILCSQALSLSTGELVPHLVSAIVGARLCQRAKNRADLSRAAPWVGVAQVAAYLMVATLDQHMMGNVQGTVLHGSSGMISAFLVASGMPFLESFFGVVTRFRLLELSDPELPLLRRLRSEAPGTYQHTLAVADLAQAAAYRINADGELVRVGILYHDIGKILAPQLFVENQFENGNPHDHMSPRDSAAAIIRHVPEGLELGRKHKLPEPILNFIPAHQGTTRAGHFYRLACEEAGRELPEQEFRYPGPRPNSRETGIAMLADTVEAIIRSLGKDADPELVNKTIRKSVQMRRSEGELSETGLGDGELDKIADAFFDCWRSKQHVRVPYRS